MLSLYVSYLLFSPGSYSDSPGIECIRRHAAEYIERRDGIPSNWHDIILSAGASDGIKVFPICYSVTYC